MELKVHPTGEINKQRLAFGKIFEKRIKLHSRTIANSVLGHKGLVSIPEALGLRQCTPWTITSIFLS